ncbi:hypothetical protein KKF38_02510 [Patescibacteria group bacterium]|nr:hypothetical protein [Patescibacteria group bacterium]
MLIVCKSTKFGQPILLSQTLPPISRFAALLPEIERRFADLPLSAEAD